MPARNLLVATAWLGMWLAVGCQSKDPGVPSAVAAEYREKLLSADSPSESRSVVEVRQDLATAGETQTSTPVVVRGTIGLMPNPYAGEETYPEFPWVTDEASFFLVDDLTVAEFKKHGHAKGEECSYCLDLAKERIDEIARVQIADAQGKPLPYRADLLLNLKEGDRLVIAGNATLHLETLLVIEPESIYIDTTPADERNTTP
jgi:hypothetical protein